MPPLSQTNLRRVIFPAIYHSGTPVAAVENPAIGDEQRDPEFIPEASNRKLPPCDGFNDPTDNECFTRSQPNSRTPSKPVRIPLDSRTQDLGNTNTNNSSVFIEATRPQRGIFTQRSSLGRYQQPLPSDLYPEAPRSHEKGTSLLLMSILRESSFGCSTPPSGCASAGLSSSNSESSRSLLDRALRSFVTPSTIRRSASEPSSQKASAKIHFDPRIWIREFERTPEEASNTWYSDQDMERFKRHTLALMVVANDRARKSKPKSPDLLATGTARTIGQPKHKSANCKFTHTALNLEGESEILLTKALQNEDYRAMIAQQELQRVLIVDPHDICVRLFQKTFKTLLPNIHVTGVTSSQQAMKLLERQSFDIILVEERLQAFHNHPKSETGSQFIRTLRSIQVRDHVLWIGVSAHLQKDQSNLESSGVDFCWGKPPPKMSISVRNELLRTILIKRDQTDFAKEVFGDNL